MADAYPWIKALHVMAIIAWMAGLFYLPRLFVYHSRTAPGSESSETFKVMEDKLLRIIMRPAMIVSWLAGLGLVWILYDLPWWLVVKLAAVVGMTAVHEVLQGYAKRFARDERPRNEGYFRMLNEVPTVLMVIIVIMVIVKPF
jgi:protoporphyrinogen IX oxidase